MAKKKIRTGKKGKKKEKVKKKKDGKWKKQARVRTKLAMRAARRAAQAQAKLVRQSAEAAIEKYGPDRCPMCGSFISRVHAKRTVFGITICDSQECERLVLAPLMANGASN